MKTKTLNTALVAAGVLAVGTAGAFSLNPGWLDKAKVGMAPATTPSVESSGDVQVAALTATAAPAPIPMIAGNAQTPNYRAIVQQFGPAVVGITVAGTQKPEGAQQGRGLPPGMEDDPFFQFFKGIPGYGQGGPRGGQGGQPQQPFRGQGSGFIISDDGLILTNAHVVRDAKEVSVKLSDRSEYAAKVLGIKAMAARYAMSSWVVCSAGCTMCTLNQAVPLLPNRSRNFSEDMNAWLMPSATISSATKSGKRCHNVWRANMA